MRLLRQPQNRPFRQYEQVIILVAATARTMVDIPVDELPEFRTKLLEHFRTEEEAICNEIESSGNLTDDMKEDIIRISKEFAENYK